MYSYELVLIIGELLILVYLLSRFATYNYIMNNISYLIQDVATDKVYKKYKREKRHFYDKSGNICKPALKAIQSLVDDYTISCQFYSKDFYYYYKTHKPILKFRVKKFIMSYIKEHSSITLRHNYTSMTPDQFFKLRTYIKGDMVGVYILYNKNRKMYYVGQATRLFFRVNQHFTGHGNGDVYADYKRGKDSFTIRLVPLVNSGYYDLDKLEKDMIARYDSYNKGYNKTKGNG